MAPDTVSLSAWEFVAAIKQDETQAQALGQNLPTPVLFCSPHPCSLFPGFCSLIIFIKGPFCSFGEKRLRSIRGSREDHQAFRAQRSSCEQAQRIGREPEMASLGQFGLALPGMI